MTAFNKEYALKEGEYVKRIPTPYSEVYKEYLYRTSNPANQTPEEEAQARRYLDRTKLFLTSFLDYDGRRFTNRTTISTVCYLDVPEVAQAGKMLSVWNTVMYVTSRGVPDIVIDPESSDHPLLSFKVTRIGSVEVCGKLSVAGDFVTRKDAPLAKLVPQLEKILREECELDVRLTLKREEHPVFVVSGAFKSNPPAWRPKGELDVYATEEGLHKEHGRNKLHPDGGMIKVDSETVSSLGYHGTPTSFVRFLGCRLQTRMVWDAPLPATPILSWINHTLRSPTEEQAAEDRDPEKVLANVSAQTGLVFKKKVRKVEVIYLSAPEPK